jgi:hypothetical protein
LVVLRTVRLREGPCPGKQGAVTSEYVRVSLPGGTAEGGSAEEMGTELAEEQPSWERLTPMKPRSVEIALKRMSFAIAQTEKREEKKGDVAARCLLPRAHACATPGWLTVCVQQAGKAGRRCSTTSHTRCAGQGREMMRY